MMFKNENSFIKTKKIRHPLIEAIQTDIPYIPNDVEIGTEDQGGFLLSFFMGFILPN